MGVTPADPFRDLRIQRPEVNVGPMGGGVRADRTVNGLRVACLDWDVHVRMVGVATTTAWPLVLLMLVSATVARLHSLSDPFVKT